MLIRKGELYCAFGGEKDYNLTIVKDCHTTADRPNIKSAANIKFHNWLWENLTPTKGKIQIKNLNEIIIEQYRTKRSSGSSKKPDSR